MSKDEATNYTSRELLRLTLTRIEEHQSDSVAFRENMTKQISEINKYIAESAIHAEYSKTKVDSHEEKIKKLEETNTWMKGVIAAIAATGAFLGWVLSTFKGEH